MLLPGINILDGYVKCGQLYTEKALLWASWNGFFFHKGACLLCKTERETGHWKKETC